MGFYVHQIDENIDCALSPMKGIGFFSPFTAPIKPISQRIKKPTLITQFTDAIENQPKVVSDEKNTAAKIIPKNHETTIETI